MYKLCFFCLILGGNDKREVPGKDSFQTHKNVDKCNGGKLSAANNIYDKIFYRMKNL